MARKSFKRTERKIQGFQDKLSSCVKVITVINWAGKLGNETMKKYEETINHIQEPGIFEANSILCCISSTGQMLALYGDTLL